MYGIPNMKLDKSVVLRRTHLMEQEGVQFVYNANVGVNVDAEALMKDYDAVILCCGASNPRDLNAPGRDAEGIHFAVDYLRANTKSLLDSHHLDGQFINAKDKRVLVIGGGDTGNDCVGTAIRQGCKSVVQFEMMGKPPLERLPSNPWPQWPNVLKTDYGQEEAIYLQGEDPRIYNTTVEEFLKDENGKLCGVTAVNLSWENGKMTKLDTYHMDVDLVLIAAGFLGCQSYVADAFGVTQTPRTCVATEEGTHKTSVDKVFAAGDMRRGQSLVVWGIREGREVAREVDEYLMGYSNLEPVE
jgi:glutamate synthase (NADPH/NADH) small chain